MKTSTEKASNKQSEYSGLATKAPFFGGDQARFFSKGSGAMIHKKDDEFEPWPGQTGTDVGKTKTKDGVTSGRVQRTDDLRYAQAQPILLEFDSASCTVTNTMEINFLPANKKKRRLKPAAFEKFKKKVLKVANEDLNGWMKIKVAGDSCKLKCKEIEIKVVAKEGSGKNAETVELLKGSGRSDAGHLHAEDSKYTLRHELGHIVLGAPDEYKEKGRPKNRINESDWSIMASSSTFGRRAVFHPRHFSHISAWLGRRFSDCTFSVEHMDRSIVPDLGFGFALGMGNVGGHYGLHLGGEFLLGLPLDQRRRLRFITGAYANFFQDLEVKLDEPAYTSFMSGVLAGIDATPNRSNGHIGGRLDARLGMGNFNLAGDAGGLIDKWVPTLGAGAALGYHEANLDFGLRGELGTAISGPDKGKPYYFLGLGVGGSF